MFLTISTTHEPATDLGFLLHKHPAKAQRFSTAHGNAHVFYPDAEPGLCTAALLLDVDPVALTRHVRRNRRNTAPALTQYVNDRPYAASSLLAVAIGAVFRTAMRGVCAARPELPGTPLPLRVTVHALPTSGGPAMVARLFEPMGWTVTTEPVPLDPAFPEWGDSRYVRLELTGTHTVAEALRHLYVLLPVLDGAKHYWVAPDEVDKLLRAGEGWLAGHPDRALIARRYLVRRRELTRSALERLAEIDDIDPGALDNAVPAEPEDEPDGEEGDGPRDVQDTAGAPAAPLPAASPTRAGATAAAGGDATAPAEEPRVTLAARRVEAIVAVLREAGARRVLDLGCGEGRLVGALLDEPSFHTVTGVDVSSRALGIAARRLRLDRMGERRRERVRLLQGALTYVDPRLVDHDAAVLSEVIEHVDEPRLPALEYAVFGAARPGTVVVTTPNSEHNVRWAPDLAPGAMRHPDHRFEWDRARFRAWAGATAATYGYTARIAPVGDDDPEVGPPTQMAVFTRAGTSAADEDTPPGGGDGAAAGGHRADDGTEGIRYPA